MLQPSCVPSGGSGSIGGGSRAGSVVPFGAEARATSVVSSHSRAGLVVSSSSSSASFEVHDVPTTTTSTRALSPLSSPPRSPVLVLASDRVQTPAPAVDRLRRTPIPTVDCLRTSVLALDRLQTPESALDRLQTPVPAADRLRTPVPGSPLSSPPGSPPHTSEFMTAVAEEKESCEVPVSVSVSVVKRRVGEVDLDDLDEGEGEGEGRGRERKRKRVRVDEDVWDDEDKVEVEVEATKEEEAKEAKVTGTKVKGTKRKVSPSGGEKVSVRRTKKARRVILSDDEDDEVVEEDAHGTRIDEAGAKEDRDEVEVEVEGPRPKKAKLSTGTKNSDRPSTTTSKASKPKPKPKRKPRPRTPSPSLSDSESDSSTNSRSSSRTTETETRKPRSTKPTDPRAEMDLTNPCQNAELLGMLVEALALARASSMTKKALMREVEGRHPGARRMLHDEDGLDGGRGRSRSVVTEAREEVKGEKDGGRVSVDGVLVWGLERGVFGAVESSGEVSYSFLSITTMLYRHLACTHVCMFVLLIYISSSPLRLQSVPPSYFYIPTSDPDPDRAALLVSLMPRPNKRKETMKYKQYYWAPVTLPGGGSKGRGSGRGKGKDGGGGGGGGSGKGQVRTEERGGRVWEVDWEE